MRHYLIYPLGSTEAKWMESRQDGTAPSPPDGFLYAEVRVTSDQTIENFWVDNGTVRVRPPRPSRFHYWNAGTWEEDTDQRYIGEAELVRTRREQLLAESDWTDTLSAKGRLGPKYDEWQAYRQELRDITKQPGYPLDIQWPVKPE